MPQLERDAAAQMGAALWDTNSSGSAVAPENLTAMLSHSEHRPQSAVIHAAQPIGLIGGAIDPPEELEAGSGLTGQQVPTPGRLCSLHDCVQATSTSPNSVRPTVSEKVPAATWTARHVQADQAGRDVRVLEQDLNRTLGNGSLQRGDIHRPRAASGRRPAMRGHRCTQIAVFTPGDAALVPSRSSSNGGFTQRALLPGDDRTVPCESAQDRDERGKTSRGIGPGVDLGCCQRHLLRLETRQLTAQGVQAISPGVAIEQPPAHRHDGSQRDGEVRSVYIASRGAPESCLHLGPAVVLPVDMHVRRQNATGTRSKLILDDLLNELIEAGTVDQVSRGTGRGRGEGQLSPGVGWVLKILQEVGLGIHEKRDARDPGGLGKAWFLGRDVSVNHEASERERPAAACQSHADERGILHAGANQQLGHVKPPVGSSQLR